MTAESLRVHVDPEKCQGHNRCYSISPELFDLDDLGMSSEIGTGTVPAELAGRPAWRWPTARNTRSR